MNRGDRRLFFYRILWYYRVPNVAFQIHMQRGVTSISIAILAVAAITGPATAQARSHPAPQSPQAQFKLGLAYAHKSNYAKSANWYDTAAQRFTQAESNLGGSTTNARACLKGTISELLRSPVTLYPSRVLC